MKFRKDDILYCMPIRFWEDKTPVKCIVQRDIQTDRISPRGESNESIYVYSEEYKHDVYIRRNSLFFSEEKCKEAIELYIQLKYVYNKDENDETFKRVLPMIVAENSNK